MSHPATCIASPPPLSEMNTVIQRALHMQVLKQRSQSMWYTQTLSLLPAATRLLICASCMHNVQMEVDRCQLSLGVCFTSKTREKDKIEMLCRVLLQVFQRSSFLFCVIMKTGSLHFVHSNSSVPSTAVVLCWNTIYLLVEEIGFKTAFSNKNLFLLSTVACRIFAPT